MVIHSFVIAKLRSMIAITCHEEWTFQLTATQTICLLTSALFKFKLYFNISLLYKSTAMSINFLIHVYLLPRCKLAFNLLVKLKTTVDNFLRSKTTVSAVIIVARYLI